MACCCCICSIYGTIVHNFMTRKIDFSLEPKNSKSISYNWWNIPQSIMYVLLSTLLIVTIPDKKLMICTMVIFWVSLIISHIISYIINKNIGNGSLWCWSIASAGIITFIVNLIK